MHFDTFVDAAVHTFFFVALGIGVTETTGEAAWLWLGWIAAAGSAINYLVSLILDARDRVADEGADGSPGREAADQGPAPRGPREWIVFAFRELSRADFCFIVLVLALFDLTWVLLPAAAAGAHVYWALRFVRGVGRYHV